MIKKLLLCCLAVIGFAAIGHAQLPNAKADAVAAKANLLKSKLKLNPVQNAQIITIYRLASAKADSISTASKGNKSIALKGLSPLKETTTAKIKKVLTPAQSIAYDKLLADKATAASLDISK